MVKYWNPQPFPVGIADEGGSRRTVLPGQSFEGTEYHKRFIGSKGIQLDNRQEKVPIIPPPATPPAPLDPNAPKVYAGRTEAEWLKEATEDQNFRNKYTRGQLIGLAQFLGINASGRSGQQVADTITAALKAQPTA